MKFLNWISIILIVLIVGSYTMGSIGIGNLDHEDKKDATFINIKNQSIRVHEKGQGPDILLIHGTPGSIEDMQTLFDSLAIDHRVIAYDRPGHGYSSAIDIPRNLNHNTLIAEEIVNYFQMDSATVIGHSYGGIIAMNMAVNKNDRVEQFYILGSPLFTFNCETIYKLFNIPILSTSLSWLVSGPYSSSKIKEELPTRFAEDSKIPTQEFINFRKELWSQPKVILSKSLETVQIEADVSDIIPKYNSLEEKVTIILGEEDVDYYITDLKAHLPLQNVEALFYEETGHFVQMESLNRLLSDIRN